MSLKEKYQAFEAWLKKQNKDKVKFLSKQSVWANDKTELANFVFTYRWFNNINEYKKPYSGRGQNYWGDLRPYILGEKKATLEDIREHMQKSLSYYKKDIENGRKQWAKDYGSTDATDDGGFTFEQYWTEQERSSGYAGIEEYNDILSFWENLSHEDVLLAVSGDVDEAYDIYGGLDGHRQYWFSHSSVHPLLFSYLYYNGHTEQELDDGPYNSNENFDNIIQFFPPENFKILTIEGLDALYDKYSDKKRADNERRFNDMIETIEKNFGNDPHFSDRVRVIKNQSF